MRYSVVIPHRGRLRQLESQLADVETVFGALGSRFEILLVNDGRVAPERSAGRLMDRFGTLRIVQVNPTSGLSAALAAGVQQAAGEIVVALQSGGGYQISEVERMLARLCRADLVYGRQRRGKWAKWAQHLMSWPERTLLGPEVRDPGCLFWVAYREALVGLELPAGMHRYLPWLVAMRGFRVHEVYVSEGTGNRTHTPASEGRWADVLSLWWRQRRQRDFQVREFRPRRRKQIVETDDTHWHGEAA